MPKKDTKKQDSIIKEIESLTVLELNELVKALEDKFGVIATAPQAAAPAAAGTEGGGTAAEEKSEYNVILAQVAADKKIAVIKVVREINNTLGLKEAKDLVDSAPKPIAEGVKKQDAQEAKKKLESAGAKVELQ